MLKRQGHTREINEETGFQAVTVQEHRRHQADAFFDICEDFSTRRNSALIVDSVHQINFAVFSFSLVVNGRTRAWIRTEGPKRRLRPTGAVRSAHRCRRLRDCTGSGGRGGRFASRRRPSHLARRSPWAPQRPLPPRCGPYFPGMGNIYGQVRSSIQDCGLRCHYGCKQCQNQRPHS